MPDILASHANSSMSPGRDGIAVTPHDSNELATWAKFLFVGTGGTVTIVTPKGTTLAFANVPDGTTLWFQAKIVKSTGTTATGIVAGID